MRHPRTARLTTCLLALATTILAAAGCDWLQPSGSESRSSPVLTDLTVIPPSTHCGDHRKEEGSRNEIEISFGYSDPQDDIFRVLLTFEHADLDERFQVSVLWSDLDLTVNPDKATYDKFFFECGAVTEGDWELIVQAEDDLGHLSNELKTGIRLLSD